MRQLSNRELGLKKWMVERPGRFYFIIYNEEGENRYGMGSTFSLIPPSDLMNQETVKQVYPFRTVIPKTQPNE